MRIFEDPQRSLQDFHQGGGRIPDPPNDLVIVRGDKRPYYDTQIKKVKQSELVSSFHSNPNCVTVRHQFFHCWIH